MGANPRKVKRWRKAQPKKEEFKIPLDDGFVIIVEYWWTRGKIVRFAAILIRLRKDREGSDEICRYDSAHGFAHLDILNHNRKVIEKVPIRGTSSYKEAVTYAINDLKESYRKRWEDFCERQRGP